MLKKYNHIFRTYSYLRLSVEDGDQIESDSIKNQRVIVNRFKENHPEIQLVGEEIDDGYTGTNFERPDFQKMMERIRSLYGNKIVVVTKDFSRLGRDTIDTVNYLEKIFPFLEVRYIAVNDDYDSNDYPYGLDFENKFKNLINGIYPMQLSYANKKIKMEEAQQGKHNGPIPTYGIGIPRNANMKWIGKMLRLFR
ncbi:recombinase family protein [Enterocloster clostridioformis]